MLTRKTKIFLGSRLGPGRGACGWTASRTENAPPARRAGRIWTLVLFLTFPGLEFGGWGREIPLPLGPAGLGARPEPEPAAECRPRPGSEFRVGVDAAAARVPGSTLEPTASLLENLTQAEPAPPGPAPARGPPPTPLPPPTPPGGDPSPAAREAREAGEAPRFRGPGGGGAGGGPSLADAAAAAEPGTQSAGSRAGARPAGQDALPGVGEPGGGRAGPGGGSRAPLPASRRRLGLARKRARPRNSVWKNVPGSCRGRRPRRGGPRGTLGPRGPDEELPGTPENAETPDLRARGRGPRPDLAAAWARDWGGEDKPGRGRPPARPGVTPQARNLGLLWSEDTRRPL